MKTPCAVQAGTRTHIWRMICIWCQLDFESLSREHAIPESLGCPSELVLENVACEGCNNGLGVVDQALLKQFEIATVFLGVRRKKGKRPTIDNWRAISSKSNAEGPQIYINGGPGIVEAPGRRLQPAAKSNGITDVWLCPEEGRAGFAQEFGNDPRFLPGLYKIGLNLVAKHFGSAVAASEEYDHIRAFVKCEEHAPRLTAAFFPSKNAAVSGASNPFLKENRPYPLFEVTILGGKFLIDLSPDQKSLCDMRGMGTLMGIPIYIFPNSFERP